MEISGNFRVGSSRFRKYVSHRGRRASPRHRWAKVRANRQRRLKVLCAREKPSKKTYRKRVCLDSSLSSRILENFFWVELLTNFGRFWTSFNFGHVWVDEVKLGIIGVRTTQSSLCSSRIPWVLSSGEETSAATAIPSNCRREPIHDEFSGATATHKSHHRPRPLSTGAASSQTTRHAAANAIPPASTRERRNLVVSTSHQGSWITCNNVYATSVGSWCA